MIWADDIEANFFATCAFLDKCSSAGIIFNRDKFQFALDEVNYLGFTITKTGIKPSADFVSNIASFSVPKSITDVRNWFVCIQQIAYTFAVSEVMLPFRQLLCPQVPFTWNDELEQAFNASKAEIMRQCEQDSDYLICLLPQAWPLTGASHVSLLALGTELICQLGQK